MSPFLPSGLGTKWCRSEKGKGRRLAGDARARGGGPDAAHLRRRRGRRRRPPSVALPRFPLSPRSFFREVKRYDGEGRARFRGKRRRGEGGSELWAGWRQCSPMPTVFVCNSVRQCRTLPNSCIGGWLMPIPNSSPQYQLPNGGLQIFLPVCGMHHNEASI